MRRISIGVNWQGPLDRDAMIADAKVADDAGVHMLTVAEARATAGLREHPMTPYLHQISCPTLVVAGGKDVVAGAGGSVVIARAMGDNARLEILQDAGHGVYRQAPDQFRSLLLEFLRENALLPA